MSKELSFTCGNFDIMGATIMNKGVNFSVYSNAENCTLLLIFDNGETKEFVFPNDYHKDGIFSVFIRNLNPYNFKYAYKINNYILLDPYAKLIDNGHDYIWDIHHTKGFQYYGRITKDDFDWENVKNIRIQDEDLIIYELHVRGFTQGDDSIKQKGTYLGLCEKIPYLKELGITAVELMPVFYFNEWENNRFINNVQLCNFWGYNTVNFFTPNVAYANSDVCNEFKTLIRELKKNKIAVILDVVFNHTAEGNYQGPTFSFKGFDNNTYYMLTQNGDYYNFSGCGNTMNCNNPITQKFIVDCLKYWVTEYKIDGFRFDLASILTRDFNGNPMEEPPLIKAISECDELRNTKLIAEAWDAGGLYQVGNFPAFGRWMEWNGKYRDDVRKYLKSDDGMTVSCINRMIGSPDIYGFGGCKEINFFTCHDGFTMYDLYSYNNKNNWENGWCNTDGDNNNHSWNCGEEGETANREVNERRIKMIKNAFATLLMSRGIPMILAGDEFCNTQYGNNNAYCHDNNVSWIEWQRFEKYHEIFDFVKDMIEFRKEHPVIKHTTAPAKCGFPQISIHNGKPWKKNFDVTSKLFYIMYAGRKQSHDDIVIFMSNSYWENLTAELPLLPDGLKWTLYQSSNNLSSYDGRVVNICRRSVMIFYAELE